MKSLFTSFLIFLFAISGNVLAQSDSYEILEKSTIQVEGTSTLHDWTSDVEEFSSYIKFNTAALEGDTLSNPVKSLSLTIPVKSIESGKGGMNRRTYDALKSDDFPNIMFQMSSAELINADSAMTSIELNVEGNLTIAGTSKKISLPVTGTKQDDGSFKFTGEYEINMKDYNVDPPSAMLGTIKAGEVVTIPFEIYVAKSQ
ncbi:YceI family protein [Fodinibius sp.]|uniref:YceI family protein n=1 Tax=Fodinibius sp. TaxID=1872440 RepID=UPI002ACD6BCF|nr:YceI family protein [Fodinibius sp.]MDZ7659068.1 YceI family protein [Fodinibius sp.]